MTVAVRREPEILTAADQGPSLVASIKAALAILAGAQIWLVFHRAFNVDEFEHAHATWCLTKGLVPYRDFFEHHTPWLYFAFEPLFARSSAAADYSAAFGLLMTCRLAMLALAMVCVTLVGELGRSWGGRQTQWLAIFLIASSIQFLDVVLEFRPDVPALACWAACLLCSVRGWRAPHGRTAVAWFAASGAAFGASLLFTQKYLFALPGVAMMLAGYLADRRAGIPLGRRARLLPIAAFVAAAAAPIAATMAWFASQNAMTEFVYYNLPFNVQQNANSFSPGPILLSNVIHSPALTVLGAIGFAGSLAALRRHGIDDRVVLVATAASLLAGLFVFGRVYGQYVIMFFPQFAVFAADTAPGAVRTVGEWLRARDRLRAALWTLPPLGCAALVVGIDPLMNGKGLSMLVAFGVAVTLATIAMRLHAGTPRHAALIVAAFTAMAIGNAARIFWPMTPQTADLRYVIEHTRPEDIFLGSGITAGAGTFRPHAWYYFFAPVFASDGETAALAAQIASGKMRPRVIGFDDHEGGVPPPLRDYVAAHYRRIQGTLYERRPD